MTLQSSLSDLLEFLTLPSTLIGMGIGFFAGFAAEKFFSRQHRDHWDEDGFCNTGGSHKLVLVVRTDLKMGKGKIAAQCSHATLKAYVQMMSRGKNVNKWLSCGQPKIAVKVNSEDELLEIATLAAAEGLPVSLIQDGGRTQVAPGSRTVLGVGPGPIDLLDKVTGHLKLL